MEPVTKQPGLGEFLGETLEWCDPTQTCAYAISNLEVDTQYDVFCVDWGRFIATPFGHVVPECPTPCALLVSTAESDTNSKDLFGVTDLAAVVLVMGYAAWSFLFIRIPIIHETAFAVLLGIGSGVLLKIFYGQSVEFSFDTFSYFFLPMVIFQAGYCLQKKNFFRYAPYTLTLGLAGTVVTFFLNFYISGYFKVVTQSQTGVTKVPLSNAARLKMAAVMASTDTVAPMAFISQDLYPALYAVVFGEGILNDVVSVLLSASVQDAQVLPAVGELIGSICKFLFASGVLGIVFGVVTSLAFKYFTALREDVVKSAVMMLGANYACYIVAEICKVSSIFALFLCALFCGHYAKYSLSHEAAAFMHDSAEMMAYFAESVVFGYFGLTAVRYFHDFHPSLIIGYVACIFVGRLVAVLGMVLVGQLGTRFRGMSLKKRELTIVWLSGCIRGTIAYALILKAVPSTSNNMNKQETVMVSTVLGIVLSNCLVVGTLFPLVMKLLRLEARPVEMTSPERLLAADRARRAIRTGWRHFDEVYFKSWLRPAGWEGASESFVPASQEMEAPSAAPLSSYRSPPPVVGGGDVGPEEALAVPAMKPFSMAAPLSGAAFAEDGEPEAELRVGAWDAVDASVFPPMPPSPASPPPLPPPPPGQTITGSMASLPAQCLSSLDSRPRLGQSLLSADGSPAQHLPPAGSSGSGFAD